MTARRCPISLFLTVIVAVGSVSFGSLLVKWNNEPPPLTIAFVRMAWATVLLFPFYARARRARPARGRRFQPLGSIVLAGLALALHHACWITSLRHTSVGVSVFLVNTAPLIVALVSFLLWKERLTGLGFTGILLAVAGAAVLSLGQVESPGTLKGALLALLGALFLGVYLTAGHASLRRTSLWLYVYPTYLISALVLGVLVALTESQIQGFGLRTHLLMFLLGLVPQCVGHTSYNRVLAHLSPTLVSLLILGEPIGALTLAYYFLGERLGSISLVGAAGVGIGVFLVSLRGIRTSPVQQIAVAIINSRHGILVRTRGKGNHLEGLLEFPGGKIENGETPAQAATREAREEVGLLLDTADARELGQQTYHYSDCSVHLHFLLFDFTGPAQPGDGTWVRTRDLDEQDFPPANQGVLRILKSLIEPDGEDEEKPKNHNDRDGPPEA